MPSCNEFVQSFDFIPEHYSNLLFNSDFDPYPAPLHPEFDPWAGLRNYPPSWRIDDEHGDVRCEPTGGLLDTAKLVISGEVNLSQGFMPLKFMPYDDEYRDDGLHANNDIYRAVYMICRGDANVMARVSRYGHPELIETEVFHVEPDDDSEVDPSIRLSGWRLHRLRYWDTPTAEVQSLQNLEIAVTTSAELELSCVYLPGIDMSSTGWLSADVAAQAQGYSSFAELIIARAESLDGGRSSEPRDLRAPPWAEALMLRLGNYMVRTENKIDRLMGALKVADSLKQAQKSAKPKRPSKAKKSAKPKRTSKSNK